MYEVLKYFEPEIIHLENIDDIPDCNKIFINEHEPLINKDRNKVCDEALFFLRNTILKNKKYNFDENKFVYITRQNSELLSNNIHKEKRRQILNEEEIIEKELIKISPFFKSIPIQIESYLNLLIKTSGYNNLQNFLLFLELEKIKNEINIVLLLYNIMDDLGTNIALGIGLSILCCCI